MAEFVEVIKQFKRMCHFEGTECNDDCYYKGKECKFYLLKYPEKSEQIIMDWAKEHPVVTNRDKFKEVINETFGLDIQFTFNLVNCRGIKCLYRAECLECEFNDFWDKEYKEPKGEQE